MKYFKIICCAAILFTVCSAFKFPKFPKIKLRLNQPKTVYAFGVAASFKDTVVYFTDIQLLDSVKLDSKGFLPNRAGYSLELRDYMENHKNKEHQTCMIFFEREKDKVQKQREKLEKVYKKDKSILLQQLSSSEFRFTKPVDPNAEDTSK